VVIMVLGRCCETTRESRATPNPTIVTINEIPMYFVHNFTVTCVVTVLQSATLCIICLNLALTIDLNKGVYRCIKVTE